MIVSDATILITLINIDRFDILEKFIDKIYITKEVYSEVTKKIYAKNFIDSYLDKSFFIPTERVSLFKRIVTPIGLLCLVINTLS